MLETTPQEDPMYSAKVTGNQDSSNQLNINHSGHKATLRDAVKNKKAVTEPKKIV
jgi:hypothetical protein